MDCRNGNKDDILSFGQLGTVATSGSILLCTQKVFECLLAAIVSKNFFCLVTCFIDQFSLFQIIWIINLVPQNDDRNFLFLVIVFLDKLQQPYLFLCVDTLNSIHHYNDTIKCIPF